MVTGDQRNSAHMMIQRKGPLDLALPNLLTYSHSAFLLAHSTLGNTDLSVALTCARSHLKAFVLSVPLHGMSFP